MTVRSPRPHEASSPTGRVLQILSMLEVVGVAADEVLSAAGVTRAVATLLRRGREALPLSTCAAIACAAMVHVEAEAARRSNVSPPYVYQHFMIWYPATISGGTLSNVIGVLQAYSKMLGGAAGAGDLQITSNQVTLPVSSVRSARDPVNFVADLFTATSIRNMLSWLIGERLSLGSLELNYPAAFAAYVPDGLVDCEIHWDQPTLALTFPRNLLDAPVIRTSADLLATQPFTPLLMEGARRAGPYAFAVARIFDEAISNERGIPGGAKVAARLRCSLATLRRRLTDERTSLLTVKKERRREWAITLLRTQRISDVAKRLGFGDETAFRRAIRQWTGRPPSSFSQRHAGGAPWAHNGKSRKRDR